MSHKDLKDNFITGIIVMFVRTLTQTVTLLFVYDFAVTATAGAEMLQQKQHQK